MQINQTDSDLFYNLGLVFHQENEFAKAIENYKKALSLNEKDQSAMYNLSLAYKQNKKFDKAINFISKVIALDPSNKDYHLSKGIIYHEMRNEEGKNEYLDFAIEAFDDVIKLDAEN